MENGTATTNVVQFEVREFAGRGVQEIVPIIDGTPLLELIDRFELTRSMHPAGGAYGGLVPAFYRFGPMMQHFLGRSTSATGFKTPVLGCECGEWGCWPLAAEIMVLDEFVVWDFFEQVHRRGRDYSGFGPFWFGRRQYEAALVDLATEIED